MNNNPYARPYIANFQNNLNQQNMYEQIDNQISQLNAMKEQMKHNATTTQAIITNATFSISRLCK